VRVARNRLELARFTRSYAGASFDLARRRVNLRAGELHRLECELAEAEEPSPSWQA
jgi:hypothetical protein